MDCSYVGKLLHSLNQISVDDFGGDWLVCLWIIRGLWKTCQK